MCEEKIINGGILNTKWILCDHEKKDNHDYDKGLKQITSFSTIQEFWSVFNNLPKPSELFFKKGVGKPYYWDTDKNKNREVQSISLFRENILPKWEDKANANGGILSLKKFYKKGTHPIDYLDELWEKIVILTIGEQFTFSDKITGLRIVDSSIVNADNPLYRIEIWINTTNTPEIFESEFREKLELEDSDKNKITFKPNKSKSPALKAQKAQQPETISNI